MARDTLVASNELVASDALAVKEALADAGSVIGTTVVETEKLEVVKWGVAGQSVTVGAQEVTV